MKMSIPLSSGNSKEKVGATRRQDPHGTQPQRAGVARHAAVPAHSGGSRCSVSSAELMRALLALAEKYPDAVIPGYTHLRRAQAVLWPHYLLAYFEMFSRDFERLEQARRASQRVAAWIGRARGQRISFRSRGHGAKIWVSRDYPQQHGCFRRSRFRSRLSVFREHGHAAPQPACGRLDSLFERRIRMDVAGRWCHQRIEPDAAKEKSRFAGIDSRQIAAAFSAPSLRCSSR